MAHRRMADQLRSDEARRRREDAVAREPAAEIARAGLDARAARIPG